MKVRESRVSTVLNFGKWGKFVKRIKCISHYHLAIFYLSMILNVLVNIYIYVNYMILKHIHDSLVVCE